MSLFVDMSSMGGGDGIFGWLAGFGIVGSLLSIALCVVLLASMWIIFAKAGEAGWKSLIPFYNLYILFKIAWGNGLLFLLTFIPLVNVIVAAIFMHKLSKAFGHGIWFTLGLIFVSYVFYPILAFGKSQYVGINQ